MDTEYFPHILSYGHNGGLHFQILIFLSIKEVLKAKWSAV